MSVMSNATLFKSVSLSFKYRRTFWDLLIASFCFSHLINRNKIRNKKNVMFEYFFIKFSIITKHLLYNKILKSLFNKNQRDLTALDRKSTRLNSSHVKISYAVFCLKKKIK